MVPAAQFPGPHGTPSVSERSVTINSLGARGPERKIIKPAGVVRILCLGGSNVYGANLSDEETWPAQLEIELNARSPGKFEVWNMGTSAYVGVQMAFLAWEVLEKYDPDLFIFALSNLGQPAFMEDAPVAPYFRQNPDFWRLLLPASELKFPRWMSSKPGMWLLAHWRFYRLAILSATTKRKEAARPLWGLTEEFETRNVAAVRKFFRQTKNRVSSCIFLGPFTFSQFVSENIDCSMLDPAALPRHEYFQGLSLPVCCLTAKEMPAAFRQIHPDAEVAAWYAKNIAAWLVNKGLVPTNSIQPRI